MLTENKAPTLVYGLKNWWIKASKTASNDAENKNRVYLSNFNRLEQEKKKKTTTLTKCCACFPLMMDLGERFLFHFTKVMEKSQLTVSATKIPRECLMNIWFVKYFFFQNSWKNTWKHRSSCKILFSLLSQCKIKFLFLFLNNWPEKPIPLLTVYFCLQFPFCLPTIKKFPPSTVEERKKISLV